MSRIKPLPIALLCAALAVASSFAARAQDAKGSGAPAAQTGATAAPPAAAPAAPPGAPPATKAAPAPRDTPGGKDAPATSGPDPKRKKTSAEKDCEAATKKAAKEQGYLDGTLKSIDSKKRALPACTTRTLCAKMETDLKFLERSKGKHEKRLAEFATKRDKVCAKVGKG